MSETLVDKLKRLLPALDTASHLARLNGSVEEAENFAKDAELMKEAIKMAEATPRWIPVTERMPQASVYNKHYEVWCWAPDREHCGVGTYTEHVGWRIGGTNTTWEVTHWSPLLDAPTK